MKNVVYDQSGWVFSFCPRPSSQGWLHLAAFGPVRNGRKLVPMRGRVRVRVRRLAPLRATIRQNKRAAGSVPIGLGHDALFEFRGLGGATSTHNKQLDGCSPANR